MIAAMAKNRVIGANNQMPWHLPADLRHFKSMTLGKPIIMGRKTYESIGKALPGRVNIVISRSPLTLNDASTATNLETAIELADENDEVMIIGGGQLYQACLPLCHRLYLTHIDLDVAGDTYFPEYQSNACWKNIASEQHNPDAQNPYHYRFEILERSNADKHL